MLEKDVLLCNLLKKIRRAANPPRNSVFADRIANIRSPCQRHGRMNEDGPKTLQTKGTGRRKDLARRKFQLPHGICEEALRQLTLVLKPHRPSQIARTQTQTHDLRKHLRVFFVK